ncbi:hypothetical protein G7092_06650 [Mucilaginibacter sp. HC2]|nr:hypothetical protein [Mucilaginibacter inviolabilis]
MTVNGHREDFSTQCSCLKEEWDGSVQRMKGTRERARSVNSWLDTMAGRCHESRQELYATGKALPQPISVN